MSTVQCCAAFYHLNVDIHNLGYAYVKSFEAVWMFVRCHTACQSTVPHERNKSKHVTTMFELLSFLLTKQELAKSLTSH